MIDRFRRWLAGNEKATPRRKVGAGVTAAAGNSFWHSPPLINQLADLLFFIGGALLLWAAVLLAQRLPWFPLRQVIVAEAPQRVSPAQLAQAAQTAISGNFFTVDLAAAQAAFEQLPWVRHVGLRRQWPDGLLLTLEEQQPVARWLPLDGETRLVNRQGEVFAAETSVVLPTFAGPEDAAPRMLARYSEFSAALGRIQRRPVALSLSSREAWRLTLDDGMVLTLGRDLPQAPLNSRLNRFIEHYATLRERLHGVALVDLRYPNGFALRAGKVDRS